MISVLLKALPIGLLLTVMPGAAFFSILQTSISRGFKVGFFLAIGISLSDIFLVALCLLGIAGIMENSETAQLIMGIIGGVILISFGSYNIIFSKKVKIKNSITPVVDGIEPVDTKGSGLLAYAAKGFALNVTNPFVWLLWIGIVPYSGSKIQEQFLFLGFILLTVLSMDILKSFFAGKIKMILTQKLLYIVNLVVGFVITCLGLILIFRVFLNF